MHCFINAIFFTERKFPMTRLQVDIFATICFADKLGGRTMGPHRPDAIRQRDANFQFLKQIKPSTDKNFTRYADQIAKIA